MNSNLSRAVVVAVLAATLVASSGARAEAPAHERSSNTTRVAGLEFTVTVDGAHLSARTVPASPTATAIAFPGRANRSVRFMPQADGTLMAMLPHPASQELAVIVSAADAHGTAQEACVLPIAHGATCRLEPHAIHVRLRNGHQYQIDRQPPTS